MQERAQRADGVTARLPRLADDEDLDRAQLAEVHIEIEVAINATQLRLEKVTQLGKLQAGYMDCAHFRQRDGAGAVHHKGAALVYLAPDLKPQLIARANHVVRRYRNIVHWRKRRWWRIEEVGSEDRKRLPAAFSHERLKLAHRCWHRGFRLRVDLRPVLIAQGQDVCFTLDRKNV